MTFLVEESEDETFICRCGAITKTRYFYSGRDWICHKCVNSEPPVQSKTPTEQTSSPVHTES